MKYLKLFEKKVLDDILDKILSDGEETLTKWEQDYLSKYGTPEGEAMEEETKPEIPDAFKDNPNDSEFDEREIIEYWDEFEDNEMHEFLTEFKVMPEFKNKPWHKLPDSIKERFQEFLTHKGYL